MSLKCLLIWCVLVTIKWFVFKVNIFSMIITYYIIIMCLPYVHTLASICAYFGLRIWAGILLCTCRSASPSVCNLFVSDRKLENDLTYLSPTQSSHPSCVAEESYWFWGSLGQRSPGTNMPKPFPMNNKKMHWPTFLIPGPNIHPQ